MPFINWSDEYSVNVKIIDDQHKKLFDIINAFYDTMEDDSKKALGKLLDSLVEYTTYHFRTEEMNFDKFRYVDSEVHKKEHQAFIDKVHDVKNNCESGKLVISVSITRFLKKWILEHIAHTDMKYSNCFNDNGLH